MRNKIKQWIALSFLMLFSLTSSPLFAELELRISKNTDDGIPLVVMPFGGDANGIIEADLKRSGRIIIKSATELSGVPPYGSTINAGQYQSVCDYIVRGKSVDGGLEVELISTSDNSISRFQITARKSSRRVAHKAADKIYEKITRIKGAFDTRLAYVSVTNKTSPNRKFRLYVADSDGYSPQVVLTSSMPILSPAWSPDGREIAYVSFENEKPAIYVQNIFSGEKRLISARQGVNGAPAWSPDGKKMAMSLSIRGNPDIYTMDLESGALTQVTESPAIDTEPVWSGSASLIFTSDRGGTPQLYQIPSNGGSATRLTFDTGYNSGADYGNRKIAYISGEKGAFNVVIRSVNDSDKVILSSGQLDESPTIAPNGAMVVYTTLRGGQNALAVVSDNGRVKQFLTSAVGDVREPAWSPYLD